VLLYAERDGFVALMLSYIAFGTLDFLRQDCIKAITAALATRGVRELRVVMHPDNVFGLVCTVLLMADERVTADDS
jgi:hypothetical protein